MNQNRKNFQYTNNVKPEVEVEEDKCFYPDAQIVKTHEMCATIIPFNLKRKVFSDITSTSPHKSIRVNLYVMVLYDYYSNSIVDKLIIIGRQKP